MSPLSLRVISTLITITSIFHGVKCIDRLTVISPSTVPSTASNLSFVIIAASNNEKPAQLRLGDQSSITLNPGEVKQLTSQFPLVENTRMTHLSTYNNQSSSWDSIQSFWVSREYTPSGKYVFVETDKEVYKPEDEVKIRVILLDEKSKTRPSTFNITILDSHKNTVRVWKGQKVLVGAISEFAFPLAQKPNLGEWEIQVKEEEDSDSTPPHWKRFHVLEYVTPKFSVELKHASYITRRNPKLRIQLEAKYTYGKGVNGQATITVSPMQGDIFEKIVLTSSVVDGKLNSTLTEFDFTSWTFDNDEGDADAQFSIMTNVTDEASLLSYNSTSHVSLVHSMYHVVNIKGQDAKPALPHILSFQIQHRDGSYPALGGNVRINNNLPASDNFPNVTATIGQFGLCKVEFGSMPKLSGWRPRLNLEVVYEDLKTSILLSYPWDNTNEDALWVSASKNYGLKHREKIDISVYAASAQPSGYYTVVDGMNVRSTHKLPNIDYKKPYKFAWSVPSDFKGPSVTLLFYTTQSSYRSQIEVLKLTLQKPHQTRQELSISTLLNPGATVSPGANVSLAFRSTIQESAVVAIKAVDLSLLLLEKEVSASSTEVFKVNKAILPPFEVSTKTPSITFRKASVDIPIPVEPCTMSRCTIMAGHGQSSGDHVFQRLPMTTTASSLLVYEDQESWEDEVVEDYGMAYDGERPVLLYSPPMPAPETLPLPPTPSLTTPRVRTHFPETWLWELANLTNGQLSISRKVPDTITKWIVSAYCVNPERGLTLGKEEANVTVFQPFFVTVNLPYAAVKAEIFALQVLIHNYLGTTKTVNVTLTNGEKQFAFIDPNEKGSRAVSKLVTAKDGKVTSVRFAVMLRTVGNIGVHVTATTDIAGDAVNKILRVNPSGIKHTQTEIVMLDGYTSHNFSLTFPKNRVIGGDYVKFSVIGDILGPVLKNFYKLIPLPTGCGEQTMFKLFSNVIVLQYLSVTQRLSMSMKETIVANVAIGYQNQLRFRKADGSFSVWASDAQGSTFLTAYVLQGFAETLGYIEVDQDVMKEGVAFLLQKQDRVQGSFINVGWMPRRIENVEKKTIYTTAYCTLTLIKLLNLRKYRELLLSQDTNIQARVLKGLQYISRDSSLLLAHTDPWIFNLITYTLQMSDISPVIKSKFMAEMERHAVTEREGLKFWRRDGTTLIGAETVEMTSLALLASTSAPGASMTSVLPIFKWLLAQRNSEGGFFTTSDTILALDAFTKVGPLLTSGGPRLRGQEELNGVVTFSKNTLPSYNFVVNAGNSIVLQEYEYSGPLSWLMVRTTGNFVRSVLAQVSWTYHIGKPESDNGPVPLQDDTRRMKTFKLNVELVGDEEEGFKVSVDASTDQVDKTEMTYIVIRLSTLYQFIPDEVEAAMEHIREKYANYANYEFHDEETKLEINFSSLDREGVKISIPVTRVDKAKVSPGSVEVYDFYNPADSRIVKSLKAKPVSVCEICLPRSLEEEPSCSFSHCE